MYACALVHFTGNEVFNRKVRFFALQTGFKLSEYGLFPVTKIGKRKVTNTLFENAPLDGLNSAQACTLQINNDDQS